MPGSSFPPRESVLGLASRWFGIETCHEFSPNHAVRHQQGAGDGPGQYGVIGDHAPIAALLGDLQQRGLLDDTRVVWAGEFGHTPATEPGTGCDYRLTDVHGAVVADILA
jgi:hypothetical protein